MEITEKAKYIDHFLRELYNSSFPTSLAMGIEMNQLPSKENKQKFKTLEYILEELDLVELINGRDNSTLDGQCEYFISRKGRELVENKISSSKLLLNLEIESQIKGNPLLDDKEWEKYYDNILDKRVKQADFFLDIVVSEKLINLDKETIKKYFKKWFNKSQEFDLQIKNGDFAIEDGDIQTVPDFKKENISDFIKWFEKEKEDFLSFLTEEGVNIKENTKNMSKKEVFVTYSWDTEEHNDKVLAFVNHLRENGFNAEMDKSYSQEHTATDFRKMMHKGMTDYDKVIIVLSEGYQKKATAFKGGVGIEYSLIIKDIEQSKNKYILVSFEKISNSITPLDFREREVIDLSNHDNFNNLYAKLQNEKLIDFSEVAKSKPTVIKKKIDNFDLNEKGLEIYELKSKIYSSSQFAKLLTKVEYELNLTIKNNLKTAINDFSIEVHYPIYSAGQQDGRIEDGRVVIQYENQPKLFPNQSRTLKIENLIIRNNNAEEILNSSIIIKIFSDSGITEQIYKLTEILTINMDYKIEKLTMEKFQDKHQM